MSPVGFSPMPNRPTSVSSLSASATQVPTADDGQQVFREARPVVLLDGAGDVGRLAVVLSVVAPHQALKLGELADHLGAQIGLGQPRRALDMRAVDAE